MTRRETDGVLVYDGDCAFCTRSVVALQRLPLARVSVVAWQHADLAALGLTREQCLREVQWLQPGRPPRGGAQAIAQLLIASGGMWRGLGVLLRWPPIRWVAAGVYRVVAVNRHRLPGGTAACALPPEERPGFVAGPYAGPPAAS